MVYSALKLSSSRYLQVHFPLDLELQVQVPWVFTEYWMGSNLFWLLSLYTHTSRPLASTGTLYNLLAKLLVHENVVYECNVPYIKITYMKLNVEILSMNVHDRSCSCTIVRGLIWLWAIAKCFFTSAYPSWYWGSCGGSWQVVSLFCMLKKYESLVIKDPIFWDTFWLHTTLVSSGVSIGRRSSMVSQKNRCRKRAWKEQVQRWSSDNFHHFSLGTPTVSLEPSYRAVTRRRSIAVSEWRRNWPSSWKSRRSSAPISLMPGERRCSWG